MELNKLKDPLPYQWRVQQAKEYGAQCVAYIDSRDVQERLDAVVGPGKWQCDYKDVKGVIYCGIAVLIENEWVWKWDAGSESDIEAEKGAASDAFKRAAVKWGIGRFLYDLEIVKLPTIDYKGKYYPKNEKTGKGIFSGAELTEYINNRTSNKMDQAKETETLAKAVADLKAAKTIDDLAAVKDKYPSVVNHADFQKTGKECMAKLIEKKTGKKAEPVTQ